MKIQIDGTNTQNKGAELMLLSILEQIEIRYPNAFVLFNSLMSDPGKIKTSLTFRRTALLSYGRYVRSVLSRIGLPHHSLLSEYHPLKNIDLVLDASGFRLGDQWNHSGQFLDRLENYYRKLKQNGTTIILLPQAFGPFRTRTGKRSVEILNRYADLIMARESVSKNYLLEAGGKADKILQFPDFTINVKGIFPEEFKQIKGHVCIIPNKKMITHTELNAERYLSNLIEIISKIKSAGKEVFLLNHEAEGDLDICMQIRRHFSTPLPVISGLNAREIKGVIGQSLMVISSRYHGVASSLNQGVPCLATSWSHKYEMLLLDFGLTDQIIDLSKNLTLAWPKIEALLNQEENLRMRQHLDAKKKALSMSIRLMWNIIWEKAINHSD
ncbi:MAG: polysaccharide pyruvyl transferase family protein [Mangrovibacterium sp.]